MTEVVSIKCPNCAQKLKIKDRALFGKKVKCPNCKTPFVPVDPDETPPDSVKPSTQAGPSDLQPDDVPAPSQPAAHPPADNPFAGIAESEPASVGPVFPSAPKAMDFLNESEAASEAASNAAPHFSGPPQGSGELPIPSVGDGGVTTLNRLKRTRKRGKWLSVVLVGGFLLLGAGVVAFIVNQPKPAVTKTDANGASGGSKTPQSAAAVAANEPYSRALLESDATLVEKFDPTDGKPIELLMMPSGVNLVVHLHPAQLWSDEYDYQVLRASLTEGVTNWIAAQLKAHCHRDPSQIEEATFGFIFGARGMPPQVCSVVHLKQPAKLSDLIEEFPGNYLYDITQKPNLRIKVDGDNAVMIHDEQTLVFCPASLAGELEGWIDTPNYEVSKEMSDLLEQTDRQRLLTIVGGTFDLKTHARSLVPEPALPLLESVLSWLGEDVEAVSWSVHPTPYLYSEIQVCPVATKGLSQLMRDFDTRLDTVSRHVWKDLCAKMQPQEMRFRKFVGRFPAMIEALQRSTVLTRLSHTVELTSVLPAKAAPNLALATLFTVNEAARTDFTTQAAVAMPEGPKLPETVAERMKQVVVDAEFNRTPLEQALQYLCDEIKVNLYVDGDALKDAGYTKNMPQTFNLGKVPMQRALYEIISKYQEQNKEMVISVDEATKTITVLTRKFAEAQGKPVYPLKPE